MAKSVMPYECKQCGNRSDNAEIIAKCETAHLKPTEIVKTTYRRRAPEPTTIKVKLSDKQIITYKSVKNNKAYQPTDEELQKAPCRVLYERDMFFASLEAYKKLYHIYERTLDEEQGWTQEADDLRKMALEAALLHARIILDFFTGDPTSNDDIQAAHFLPGFTGWKSDKLGLLRERRKDLNSGINHLTYRRTKGRLDWDELEMIHDEVRVAFEEFISLLHKDEQPRWLASRP